MGNKGLEGNNLPVTYLKTNDFRTNFASGAFGGITPQGLIDMNFYVERPVIPKRVVVDYSNSQNKIEKTISSEGLDGIVREVFGGIVLNKVTAQGLVVWLKDKIENIEKIEHQIQNSKEGK